MSEDKITFYHAAPRAARSCTGCWRRSERPTESSGSSSTRASRRRPPTLPSTRWARCPRSSIGVWWLPRSPRSALSRRGLPGGEPGATDRRTTTGQLPALAVLRAGRAGTRDHRPDARRHRRPLAGARLRRPRHGLAVAASAVTPGTLPPRRAFLSRRRPDRLDAAVGNHGLWLTCPSAGIHGLHEGPATPARRCSGRRRETRSSPRPEAN